MSSVVKTVTPFINKDILLKALKAIGCNYTIENNTILTDRHDYNGIQKFVFTNGRYAFQHDSDHWGNINSSRYKTVSSFLQAVGAEYNSIYQRHLKELERLMQIAKAEEERRRAEEEKLRLEQERKKFVEKQKAAIIENAKKEGWNISESFVNNKVEFVLIKTTY